MNPALLVALAAAVFGPLVAYLGASRKLSGKIGTSEASELWAESKAIRDEYRERQVTSDLRTADLEKRVASLERDNNSLSRENIDLTRKVVEYEQIIKTLNARLDVLERENKNLRDLVTALQERLGKETS